MLPTKTTKEGYQLPPDYQARLRQELLTQTLDASSQAADTVPENYHSLARKAVLDKTIGQQPHRQLLPRLRTVLKVAAAIVPLIVIAYVWQSNNVASTETSGFADVKTATLYQYATTYAEELTLEEMIDHGLVDGQALEDLPITTTSTEEIEGYLQNEIEDIDLLLLSETL